MDYRERMRQVIDDADVFSKKKLADDMGCSEWTVYMWRRGNTEPCLTGIMALCDALDISAHWLLFGEEPKPAKGLVNLKSRSFGTRLRMLLAERNWTQRELAKRMKRAYSTISWWCLDNAEPKAEAIIEMCKALGVSADYLIFGEERREGGASNETD